MLERKTFQIVLAGRPWERERCLGKFIRVTNPLLQTNTPGKVVLEVPLSVENRLSMADKTAGEFINPEQSLATHKIV